MSLKGFFSRAFNQSVAADRERLENDMLQAFYRREHGTVDMLEHKDAPFNTEMLHIAVTLRDITLAEKCTAHGVAPEDSMLRYAVDQKDTAMTALLLQHMPMTENLRAYILQHGTEDILRISGQK